ncbi:MAG: response regulator [Alsobacter sp.]
MSGPRSAIVVDDDAITLVVMARMLEEEGFEVQSAASATAALRLMKTRACDLIAADHQMLPITGLDFWTFLRTSKKAPHARTPFILITSPDRHAHLSATHPELPVVLRKPFNGEMLRRAIRDAQDARQGPAGARAAPP